MGRGKHCTDSERLTIKKLYEDGKTYAQIQKIINCSPTMIANALKTKLKAETRGRKCVTTAATDRNIIRLVKKNPSISSKQIKEDLNLVASPVTIRRRLAQHNLKAKCPRRVPLLQKRHVQKRLKFANDYITWPISKWRNILWSDESKIVLFGSSGSRQYVRRPPRTEFKPQYTIKTVKHGGAKINIWGCFSYHGVGPIFWIKGNLDQHMYVDILQNTMLPYVEENMPLNWIFMQDNDPKHTSKKAKNWLECNKIKVLDWPAQSPDLNPIENLWTDIKKEVFIKKPTTTQNLWNVVEKAWYDIPPQRCAILVDSMQRRCSAVIKNCGFPTKY